MAEASSLGVEGRRQSPGERREAPTLDRISLGEPARAGGVTEWGSWKCQSGSGRADATSDSRVMVFESAVAAERGPEARGCGKLKRL